MPLCGQLTKSKAKTVDQGLLTSASDWRGHSEDGVAVLEEVWLWHVGLGEDVSRIQC